VDPVFVPAGESRTIAVAGVPFRFAVEPRCGALRLPPSYEPFLTCEPAETTIRAGSRTRLQPAAGQLLYESNHQWRALKAGRSTAFQFHHPPTGLLHCQAIVSPDFSTAEVLFSEEAWRLLGSQGDLAWELPYPLDQLLLIPPLALEGAVLFHACGATIANRGLVFAGHSGDGKTTLAGLLSREGTALLSDERVAVRGRGDGFTAFGTPWPGEGNVVSSASHPLAGMFVLRKAASHALGTSSPTLAGELLARAIVPYYLPDIAGRIFEIFSRLATEVPLRELHFARASGLSSLLRDAA